MNSFLNKQIKEQEQKIKDASQKYYTDGTSFLTDEEFDQEVEKLKMMKPDSDALSTGWGYDINKDTTPGEKIRHKYGLVGSLDKCRTYDEVPTAMKGREKYAASLKLDGMSVVLYYEHNRFVQAVTRGDGTTGVDITEKVRKIYQLRHYNIDIEDNLDLKIDFTGAVRGEILMRFEDFDKLHEQHPEYKNPRNTTVGIINAKDHDDSFLSYLDIQVYTIVGSTEASRFERLGLDVIVVLQIWFSNVAPYTSVSFADDESLVETMSGLKTKWYGIWPADGIVLTADIHADDIAIIYNSCAYKFASEVKKTVVKKVEWNMSKSGYAIPKLLYDEIILAGSTCKAATGYNAKFIKDNNLNVGSVIDIEKRGEIIPNVVKVYEQHDHEADLPTVCQDCGRSLVWRGVHLKCLNENCPSRMINDTLAWINFINPTFGIGDTLIEQFLNELVDESYIESTSVESIMTLDMNKLPEFPSGAKKSLFYNHTLKLIHQVDIEVANAYQALNIIRVGDKSSQKLANLGPDVFNNLINYAVTKLPMYWNEIADKLSSAVGIATTSSLLKNIDKVKRLRFIRNQVVFPTIQKTRLVAITGKLSVKRSDFEAELKKYGFVADELKKDTFCLITDNPDSGSLKNKKADQYGIQKMTESTFKSTYMKTKND